MPTRLLAILCVAALGWPPTALAREAPEGKTVQILFVGDIMHHRRQKGVALWHRDGPVAGYASLWRDVAPRIAAADLAVGNLECPVTGGDISHYPRFNAPTAFLDALTLTGFDALGVANNHAHDQGRAGLAATIAQIRQRGIRVLGTRQVGRFEIKGVRVGILAATEFLNSGGRTASDQDAVIVVSRKDPEALERLADEVRRLRPEVDLLVLSLHWGAETRFEPQAWQREWARKLAEAGVDVLVGHHSHSLGPTETLVATRGHRMFVAYSLGNFSSGMHTPGGGLGGILTVRFDPTAMSGDRVAAHLETVWTQRTQGRRDRPVYRTVPADSAHDQCRWPIEDRPFGIPDAECRILGQELARAGIVGTRAPAR